jgi:hypothetical protein
MVKPVHENSTKALSDGMTKKQKQGKHTRKESHCQTVDMTFHLPLGMNCTAGKCMWENQVLYNRKHFDNLYHLTLVLARKTTKCFVEGAVRIACIAAHQQELGNDKALATARRAKPNPKFDSRCASPLR